jgi:N-acetylmuramoyl-L-alanine amidase
MSLAAPPPAQAVDPVPSFLSNATDFAIPGGRFYKQANGLGGAGDSGFAVIDDGGAKFWSEFQRLGGVDAVGYPISRRVKWGGYTVQAFQRGVLQWRPDIQQGWFVNVFDMMHDLGYDAWLSNSRATPAPLAASFDAGKDWPAIVKARQALLDANPAIRSRYWASPDPMTFFGLPTSRVTDNGTHFAIRLQRAVIQQWKVDVPWAKAGQVTVANGGDIGAEAGLYPPTGYDVQAPVGGRNGKIVVIDGGHGGTEVGAARVEPRLVEKDINLEVVRRMGAILAANGYTVVLTRNADKSANHPARELAGDDTIDMKDDLQARIDIANNANAHIFVSVHFNGFSNPETSGAAVHYTAGRPHSAQSLALARSILAGITQNIRAAGYTSLVVRGVQDDSALFGPKGHLYIFSGESARASTMPGVLTESLFITSPADALQLSQPKIIQAIASGHAQGIAAYFGLPISDDTGVVVPPPAIPTSPAPAPSASPAPSTSPAPAPTAKPSPSPTPSSPAATPSPTPRPSGQRLGRVKGIGQGVTMRVEPKTTGTTVMTLPEDTQVVIVQAYVGEAANGEEARWFRVQVDGKTGYIYAPLVVILDPKLALPPSSATVTSELGYANARTGPSVDQAVIQRLDNDTLVNVVDVVLGQNVDGTEARWYLVLLGDTPAYIYGPLLDF